MTPSTAPVELLERAICYTRAALLGAGDDLASPTPCRDWDLGQLLDHIADSLDALVEASSGRVALVPAGPGRVLPPDRMAAVRGKACAVLGAWSSPTGRRVQLADTDLHVDILLRAGALEIAVHGWDVARATGRTLPIPADLARDLLPVARLLVSDADRGPRFADPLAVPQVATCSARLLAFLGRAAARPA